VKSIEGKMQKQLHNLSFPKIISILTVLIYIINVLWNLNSLNAVYGVNDDYLIKSFLDGTYLGESITNTTYINELLGYLISFLYSYFPLVPIYNIFLLITVVLTLVGVLITSYRSQKTELIIIKCLVWLITATLITNWFMLSPTFTAASIIVTTFGYYLVLRKLLAWEQNRNLNLVTPLIFLTLGFLLRVKGFQGASLVWVPLLAFVLLKLLLGNREILKYIFSRFNILSSGVLLFMIIVSNLSMNSEWKVYYEYNNLRQEIVNTTRVIQIEQNLNEVGWDKAKLINFDNYTFADKDFFNDKALRNLIQISNKSQGLIGLLNPVVSVDERLKNISKYNNFLLSILILPLIFLIISSAKQKIFIFFTFIFLSSLCFGIYYILATGKIEERVIVPLFLGLWFYFFSLPSENSRVKNLSAISLFTIFLVPFAIFFEKHTHEPTYYKERSKWNGRAIEFSTGQQKYLAKFGPEAIFVGPLSAIRQSWSSPYMKVTEPNFRFISLGWHNFSPAWVQKNNSVFRNTETIYENLKSNPTTYWVSDPYSADFFFEYLASQNILVNRPKLVGQFGSEQNDYGGYYNVYSLNGANVS
jgi:hypothetical protein